MEMPRDALGYRLKYWLASLFGISTNISFYARPELAGKISCDEAQKLRTYAFGRASLGPTSRSADYSHADMHARLIAWPRTARPRPLSRKYTTDACRPTRSASQKRFGGYFHHYLVVAFCYEPLYDILICMMTSRFPSRSVLLTNIISACRVTDAATSMQRI